MQRLVTYIQSGSLRPGDVLPSQHELARQLSVYVDRTHLVLPSSIADALAAFDRADEAYMASIASPIAAVS